jgi:cell division protein FtsL
MEGFEEYDKFDPASFEYIDPIKEYEKPIEDQSVMERANRFVSNKFSFFGKYSKHILCIIIVLIILFILCFLYKKYASKQQIYYNLAP